VASRHFDLNALIGEPSPSEDREEEK
jgi:hypothetical protein